MPVLPHREPRTIVERREKALHATLRHVVRVMSGSSFHRFRVAPLPLGVRLTLHVCLVRLHSLDFRRNHVFKREKYEPEDGYKGGAPIKGHVSVNLALSVGPKFHKLFKTSMFLSKISSINAPEVFLPKEPSCN